MIRAYHHDATELVMEVANKIIPQEETLFRTIADELMARGEARGEARG